MANEIGDADLVETWASDGAIQEPEDAKIDQGFVAGERPAFQFVNWLFNSLGQKINHVLSNGMPLWKASRSYAQNQVVLYQGAIYRADNATTGDAPSTSPTHWTKISL